MFGYVKACKSEMKVKEYELYSAAYCGLCRAMGKCTGQLSRFTLSYDLTFLSLVRCALEKEKISVSRHRCIAHPLKKRPMIDVCPALIYSAGASAELSYFKLEDDIRDSKRTKKLLASALFPFFKHFKKKSGIDGLGDTIKKKLDALSDTEKEKSASVDLPAELFGELLGEVFSHGLDGPERKIAYAVGLHTGKFIYAADAADDYPSDLKSGSYNPFVQLYGNDFSDDKKQTVKTALLCELQNLEAAVNLIDFSTCPDIGEIVYNIIYLGMPEQMENALYHNKSERTTNKNERPL